MKKEYVVEILCAIAVVLLLFYMIFTWKRMTPDTESATEVTASVVDSEGGEV